MNRPALHFATWLMAGAAVTLAGCGGKSDENGSPAEATATPAACEDGGERLPGSGICVAEAGTYMTLDALADRPAPEGCTWETRETPLPEEQFLLYRALTCPGGEARIAFVPGIERAEIRLSDAALPGAPSKGATIGYVYPAKGTPEDAVLARAKEAAGEGEALPGCIARPAQKPEWPGDALVVAPADTAPGADCGPFGQRDGIHAFWRVSQGRAWYFDFGDGAAQIVPSSLTIVPGAGQTR